MAETIDIISSVESDFISLYYVNLNTNQFTVDKINGLRGDVKDAVTTYHNFKDGIANYIQHFVEEKDIERLSLATSAEYIREQFQTKTNFFVEYEVKDNKDQQKYFELHFIRADEDGSSGKFLLGWKCVDTKHQHMKEKQDQEDQLNKVLKESYYKDMIVSSFAKLYNSAHILYLTQDRYEVIDANKSVTEVLDGHEHIQEAFNNSVQYLVTESYKAGMYQFLDVSTLSSRLKNKTFISHEFLGVHTWTRGTFIPLEWNGNILEKVIYITQVIDDEKKKELEYQHALEESYRTTNVLYRESLQMSPAGYLTIREADQEVLAINDAYYKMLGCDKEEIKYHQLYDLLKHTLFNYEEVMQSFIMHKQNENGASYEHELHCRNGQHKWVMNQIRRVKFENGESIILNTVTDITDRKKMETEIITLSRIDGLTKLLNRISGENDIEDLLSDNKPGMFCLFDVDKFKHINDTYGHMAGDKVLQSISNILLEMYSDDITMRPGGDEFAIYAQSVTCVEKMKSIIEEMYAQVQSLRLQEVDNETLSISIGVILYDRSSEESFDTLYRKADQLMYKSKQDKNNYYHTN